MKNLYIPDRWVVVEVRANNTGESHRKVMASWYGGYTTGDSWKLSSSIERVVDKDTHFEFHCSSGSMYKCHKNSTGMSAYVHSVFCGFVKDLEGTGTLEVVEDY